MAMWKFIIAIAALLGGSGFVASRLTSDMCLVPLAFINEDLCPLIFNISDCYVSSYVPRATPENRDALQASVNGFQYIMTRLEEEGCDLNEEFNNECHDGFYHCLDHVLTEEEGKYSVKCELEDYEAFLACTNIRIPNSYGKCYYSRWIELIVHRTREVNCTNFPNFINPIPLQSDDGSVVAQPDFVDDGRDFPAEGSYCERDDTRYHVLDGCTKFRKEWVSLGIQYEVQDVAPGTLFDVEICGLNHQELVNCPV